jgi:hypothetical protein
MVRWVVGLAFVLVASPVAPAPAPHASSVGNESFSFPLPEGYRDITNDPRLKAYPRKQVTVEALAETLGYRPTITVFLAPIWGGTLGDAKVCRESAANIAGPDGKVKGAAMIPGPRGTVCQMHIVQPQGVALMTELISFTETWLMTCNHADGDQQAEKVCRATLAAFKFKEQGTPAKIDLPHLGVRECDDYLQKFRACIWSRFSKTQVSALGFALKLDAESLKKAAATDGGRKTLPGVCATMLANAKSAVAHVNCEW